MTRLFTRMSAEEMTRDPFFEPADPDAGDIGTQRDADPTADCTDNGVCNFAYCGREGVCTERPHEIGAICVCRNGAVARATTTGVGNLPMPYCEPLSVNFGEPSEQGACEGVDCGGLGRCVEINGVPGCICDTGAGATVPFARSLEPSCVPVDDVPEFPSLPPIPTPNPIGGAAPVATQQQPKDVDSPGGGDTTAAMGGAASDDATDAEATGAAPPNGAGDTDHRGLCGVLAPGAPRQMSHSMAMALLLPVLGLRYARRSWPPSSAA